MAASTVARVAQMARVLVALAAVLLPAVVADPAVIQPQPELPPYFNSYGMVMKLNPVEMGVVANSYPVVPLTTQMGLNTTNYTMLNSISFQGSLVSVDQSNYNLFNDSSQIAYISCDSNVDESNISPSDVINALMGNPTKPAAILLYTTNTTEVYCSLQGDNLAFDNVFSMVSSDDGSAVENTTTSANGKVSATIDGKETDPNNGPNVNANGGNNSAVAMSILYSITGLITLLFLVIIATGAVRAHRHPERYGPRAGYGGRARQSRARGLARAVLDTLPIVKFGDQNPPPAKGDPDQELESVAGDIRPDADQARRSGELPAAVATAGAAAAVGTEAAHQNRAASTATAPAANSTAENNSLADEHLGCTICTEDFTVGEDVRVLPCDHKFHPACIDPWLVNVSGTCPLCRLDLRPQESQGESRDSSELPSFNSAGGEAAAPDANPETIEGRRRSRLLDWNRLRHASVDERIHALRQMRQQGNPPDPTDGTQQASLTDRLRERFHIRTRTQS